MKQRKEAIIETTTVSISLNCALVVFARDADSDAVIFGVLYCETVHGPVGSKKGSSFFEDPAYFVFSEAVFLCNHARGLDPTCFSFLQLLF